MINFDFNSAQDYLNKFGINLLDYETRFGGSIGVFKPPMNLIILNPDLKNEKNQVFTLMALNIFNSANNVLNQKPSKIAPTNFDTFINVVGQNRANNFRSAIYEEIKWRSISNYVPELENKTTASSQNISMDNNRRALITSYDLLCAAALEYLEADDWNVIDVNNLNPDSQKTNNLLGLFLTKDFSNIQLNRNDWNKILQVNKTDDGNFVAQFNEKIKNANLDGCNEYNCLINQSYLIDCNIVGNSTIEGYDTSLTVDSKITQQLIHAGNFPWDPKYSYKKDQSCIYNTKFYISLVSDNLNNIPDLKNSNFWRLKPDILPELYFNKTESDQRYVIRGSDVIIPVGQIMYYPRKLNPKPDWLEMCNGQSFDSNDYPELAAYLGNNIIPNLVDYVFAHSNDDNDIGKYWGKGSTTLTIDNIPQMVVNIDPPTIKIPVRSGWDYDTVSDNSLNAIAGIRANYRSHNQDNISGFGDAYYRVNDAKLLNLTNMGDNWGSVNNAPLVSINNSYVGSSNPQSFSRWQPTYSGVAYIVTKPIKINGFSNYNDAPLLQKIQDLELKVNELIKKTEN